MISYYLKLLRARYRLMLSACPMCNSDAPELDTCPICNGYHSAKGLPFPVPNEIKQIWFARYKQALKAKQMITKAVAANRGD